MKADFFRPTISARSHSHVPFGDSGRASEARTRKQAPTLGSLDSDVCGWPGYVFGSTRQQFRFSRAATSVTPKSSSDS